MHTSGNWRERIYCSKPDDPDIVYIGAVGSSPGGEGALQHYNHRTRQLRLINIWPEEVYGWAPRDIKYRFSWTYPISFSPHDWELFTPAGITFSEQTMKEKAGKNQSRSYSCG